MERLMFNDAMLKSKAWFTLTPALLSLVACGQHLPSAGQATAPANTPTPGASAPQSREADIPDAFSDTNLALVVTPSSTFAQRVLDLTNAARAQGRNCGAQFYAAAPALVYHSLLERSAQAHAADMATRNYFSHTSQDGRSFSQRISATGYNWRTVGENIAAGYPTPESVVDGWLKSPGHCANIMNPAFREIGIGYSYSASSAYKYYWVQDFGTRW